MKTCCIILARAGSRGLPGKNVIDLHGRPLVAYTIDHALAATCLDRIVLSTDGQAIAAVGRAMGIEVIDRPANLADDLAPVDAAARHALQQVERTGQRFDAAVILYGNVPLRPADLIDRAVAHLKATGADSVQSVCPVGKTHPYWMKRLTGPGGDVLEHYQPNHVYRRQDLPPVYMLDGGIIAVRRHGLMRVVKDEPHAFLGDDRRAIVTEPGQVIDIDTAGDLRAAEAAMCGGGATTSRWADGFDVAGRAIRVGGPAYIIAELGVNHDGSINRALELTRAAADAGAEAVKLQLFDAKLLLSAEAELAAYQTAAADDPFKMLQALQLTGEQMMRVRDAARRAGLGFIVTCFSIELADVMRRLEVDAVKVASPDCVNLPLIEAMARLGRPMLVSMGATEPSDAPTLARMVRRIAVGPAALLHCVSAYPVPSGQARLCGIGELRRRYRLPVGYSDHTTDERTGMLAVAAGACVIEKHLTYNRNARGPDHAASFDPEQFGRYVRGIREAEVQLGWPDGHESLQRDVRRVARQSVCALKDLPAGQVIARSDVTVRRPGTGVPAAMLDKVVGRRLLKAVRADCLVHHDAVDWADAQERDAAILSEPARASG